MADRVVVLIPLPGVGMLAMSREAYAEALEAGAQFVVGGSAPSPAGSAPEPLLDADQAAAQLNVTARWLEDSARAGIIPHHKLGRFLRFRVSELAEYSRIEGAPMLASTDNPSVTPIRRLSRQ
jgi:excisionase family DNA binding protein